jgi:hypothetical protein
MTRSVHPSFDFASIERHGDQTSVTTRRSMASPISAARLSSPDRSRQQDIAERLKAAEQRLKRAAASPQA